MILGAMKICFFFKMNLAVKKTRALFYVLLVKQKGLSLYDWYSIWLQKRLTQNFSLRKESFTDQQPDLPHVDCISQIAFVNCFSRVKLDMKSTWTLPVFKMLFLSEATKEICAEILSLSKIHFSKCIKTKIRGAVVTLWNSYF